MQSIDDEYRAYWNASRHLDADWAGVPQDRLVQADGKGRLNKETLFQRLLHLWPSKSGTGKV
jgi:hypothetical protein